MRDQTGGACEQDHHYVECGGRMAEHLNREQSTADWSNDCVDGIPGGIDPWDFVSEKFQEIKDTGDDNDRGVTEDFERLIVRGKFNPMLVNGEAGNENGQVEIYPGQAGQSQRDAEEI